MNKDKVRELFDYLQSVLKEVKLILDTEGTKTTAEQDDELLAIGFTLEDCGNSLCKLTLNPQEPSKKTIRRRY